jgi:aryl-alcohol dehydrogenase-like predicted oxidoreductase
VLHRALDLGVTHFDTAALYGFGANETLVGEMLAPFRQRIHLASKCGMTAVDGRRVIDGRPETLQRTLEEALRRLRTDVIDLYYLHRWDKTVPIEDSVGALATMVKAGKIRAIGLSEVSAPTLRRAHAVHPVAAVQSEYSLWSRNVEVAVLDECRRIGAALVAFSPLGRGFLADSLANPAELLPNDIRRGMPRFQEPHWSTNARLLTTYRALAVEAGCTPAQLALAWLLQKALHVIPIPGTTSLTHLEDNVQAAGLTLSPELVARLEALVNGRTISGARYPPAVQLEIDTEELP